MLTSSELKHLAKTSDEGDKQAACHLAIHQWVVEEITEEEFISKLQRCSDQSVDALVYLALYQIQKEKYQEAIRLLAKAIDAGDPDAPYFLWTLKPKSQYYLKMSYQRGSLLAIRALARHAPKMNELAEFMSYHKRALEHGDLDSFYFLCLDGPTYYEPELTYLLRRAYTPYIEILLEENREAEDRDTTHFAAMAGIKSAHHNLGKHLMIDKNSYTEALYWLENESDIDSERAKDIGLCYLARHTESKDESDLIHGLINILKSKELGNVEAEQFIQVNYPNIVGYLNPNYWRYKVPRNAWLIMLAIFAISRMCLLNLYELHVAEWLVCIALLIGSITLIYIKVPRWIYALTDDKQIQRSGRANKNIYAMAKDPKTLHKAADMGHLPSMYRAGIEGDDGFLQKAVEAGYTPAILEMAKREEAHKILILEQGLENPTLDTHLYLGELYFNEGEFAKAAEHLQYAYAKKPDDLDLELKYAWALQNIDPVKTQWHLVRRAEEFSFHAIFRLRNLRLLSNFPPSFDSTLPEPAKLLSEIFLQPPKTMLEHLQNLSFRTIYSITESNGKDIWKHCEADLKLKQRIRRANVYLDSYPKSTVAELEEYQALMIKSLEHLRKKQLLKLQEKSPDLLRFLRRLNCGFEALSELSEQEASILHLDENRILVNRAFKHCSKRLQQWFLSQISERRRRYQVEIWKNEMYTLTEIYEAQEMLLLKICEDPKIRYPYSEVTDLRTKMAQLILTEFTTSASESDRQTLFDKSQNPIVALAFLKRANMQKFISGLLSQKDTETYMNNWKLERSFYKLTIQTEDVGYSKASIEMLELLVELYRNRQIQFESENLFVYSINIDQLSSESISLLVNELEEPLNFLSAMPIRSLDKSLVAFYKEEIQYEGHLFEENQAHQHLVAKIKIGQLIQKGQLSRERLFQ
ncbi:MAG: hypothetical protein VX278_02885 [Myxococcota bacterium]|nr:hypothetical protein [Myxococcota bacterium]